MDAESFDLLAGVVDAQTSRINQVLDGLATGQRGSTYGAFVQVHVAAITNLSDGVRTDYVAADVPERVILGRKLYRFKLFLDEIHAHLVEHRNDIGRRDLPVGILHLVDALIEDLLKSKADPIIHFGQQYMYSTARLPAQWEVMSNQLGVAWTEVVEPVVINLPGLDPTNALLSPILAHEVGHSVIQRHDLVNEVGALLDAQVIAGLRSTYEATSNADAPGALQQFGYWVEELLCDALATELTGPGLLFSSAVFLPASAAGSSGDHHPDPAQRIALTLGQLSQSGWRDPLIARLPSAMAWLESVAQTPVLQPSPRETFLRALVDHSAPAIIRVAQDYVLDARLQWSDYAPAEDETTSLLSEGIPPAEIQGSPVSPWHVVAAVWMHGLQLHGDGASGLAAVVGDSSLSRFALKSVEMSRVLELWRSGDVAPT